MDTGRVLEESVSVRLDENSMNESLLDRLAGVRL